MANDDLCRYAVIEQKNPREIVLLRGLGCAWKKCRFCDYHLDASSNAEANFTLNSAVLSEVTGLHQRLEVINSGSFFELDAKSAALMEEICDQRQIAVLHVESHWMYHERVPALREHFAAKGVTLKTKLGVETFDSLYREKYLNKGMLENNPEVLRRYFNECCLLVGLCDQTEKSMCDDIETALAHFERVCVNVMCERSAAIRPDEHAVAIFQQQVLPRYIEDPRVDILLQNSDFGVGGIIN